VITDIEYKEANEKKNKKKSKKIKNEDNNNKNDENQENDDNDDNDDNEENKEISLGLGTGIVHCSPFHGKDDMDVCLQHNVITLKELETCCLIDDEGKYTSVVTDFSGQQIFVANNSIIDDLRNRNLVLRSQMMT